jgi:hypothetical protein
VRPLGNPADGDEVDAIVRAVRLPYPPLAV